MKNKTVLLLTIALLLFFGVSCSPESKPDITGIIFSMDGETILVVEGVELDTSYDEWFEDGNLAISFTVDDKTIIKQGKENISIDDLNKGQMVKVWATGPLAKSYPLQGTARQITVIVD